MSTNPKRATVLPNSLWRGQHTTGFIESQITPPEKALEKTHATPLVVPTIAKEIQQNILRPKAGSLNTYHRSYNIDQAGPGVIALKDSDNLPSCLIKECEVRKLGYIRKLRPISHTNLISLLDYFQSGDKIYLVYEYEHMAISLGCIAGIVEFNEADIATLCKEILIGLKYIHSELKTSYGQLTFSNIVLTWKGDVKIANIGECLLAKEPSATVQKDIKDVGEIVVKLSDRTTSLSSSTKEDTLSLSRLARSFLHRTKTEPISSLIKDEFLNLANPGGAWSLKRHYFETLPMGIRIGSHASKD